MHARPAPRVESLERRVLLASTITGTVFNDLNGNGVRDSGEPGLANQRVYVDLNFDGRFQPNEPSALSNASGVYTLPNRPNGIQRIATVVPTGRRLTAPASVFRDVVVVGSTISNVNFGSTNTAVIRGTVFADTNGNGRRDTGERGLQGWTLYLDKNNNGKLDPGEKTRSTDVSGNYRFAGLTPGTYNVRIAQQAGYTRINPLNGLFRQIVAAGESFSNRNFAERPSGS
jgi:serine-aspartate repeat-containing protein C/D/E